MTVAVTAVDPAVVLTLQQTTTHIPFEEISRIVYNTFVPGRFGKIHTGRWKDEDVELKQPLGDHATIEKDVRLLHKLRHSPQILRLHGYTIDPSTSIAYLVVQHTEHGTLHSYLLNFHPHLTWPDRYNLALDIALGLRYLHHKGCRHRHLHSASVLIDMNGSAVLSDFGNSKDSDVVSSREHTTRMAYLAPERLSKAGTRYSVECDVYSLGMVFWEISSGRPPFNELITPHNINNGSLTSLAQNIVSGRRERPVQGTDPLYEDLYTRCWHPDPQERPTLDWIIQTLGVLLKQPSGFILRQLEDLSIEEGEEPQAMTPFVNTSKALNGISRSMSIKVPNVSSQDYDRDLKSPLTRSRELTMSPREPDYPPSPPAMPPPIPPVSQRRKMSAAASYSPPMRSMSISSGSSSGSSTGSAQTVPVVPTRDARRVSTMTALHSSAELPQHSKLMKRRSPQTIWEACQEGNADLAEWHILTTGTSPDGLVSLPAYSMLAEVGPIHVVCFYQPDTLTDVLKALQRNGANMDLRTTLTSQSALHVVLEHATNYNVALEAVKYLILECKLSVNEPDNRGLTPFHKYIKNPCLSDIISVAGSELYTLLRDKGQANLSLESLHEGNSLGMTARYLRVDLMKMFLLTDLSCSEPKSVSYASNAVEAPLSESRSSKSAQDMCRTVLAEWKGERGEKKRMVMAERILGHQGISISSITSSAPSPSLASASAFPGPSSKGKRQGGLLSSSKSSKDSALGALPPKVASDVDVAKKVLQSTAIKQRKLKNLIADSGF